MTAETNPKQPSLAERLRSVRVGTRQDLDVSRHVFRGESAYIIRDPVTFQSHWLSPADYQVFISIDAGHTLGDTFDDLQSRGVVNKDDEEAFYRFVFNLHRLGFLSLPISDQQVLFKRYQARQRARRRQNFLGFLFLQIPLVNPDGFLTRTMPAMRWLYSRLFFCLWLILVGAAGFLVATRWVEMLQPIHGLLAARNLLLMWITLALLKLCHEFGHAYACKHFGGHVPEMGVYLIAFTPCAYVDATAAWGFSRKRDRLIVSMGGMYVESIIAAVAVFVWAFTGPSLLNAVAYNVIFLASTVTVLFNINPLMRFDGYYLASDWLEIPNLRQRSTQYVLSVARRWLLGIRSSSPPMPLKLRTILFTFGVAAAVYRTLVLIGIAAVVASKLFIVGLGLAIFFGLTTLFGIARRLAGYLWFSKETAAVRGRAIVASVVLFLVLPSAIGLIPVPRRVCAAATVVAENETIARATTPGFVEYVGVEVGQTVEPNTLLARLSNTSLRERVLRARGEREASQIRHLAYAMTDPAAAQAELERQKYTLSELAHAEQQVADLRIAAPQRGCVIQGLRPSDTGRFVQAGEFIAMIISGRWHVRTILGAEEFAATTPFVGQQVTFRAASAADATHVGTIVKINPVGSRRVDLASLTHLAGGDVVVDPDTGNATKPYFEIDIALDAQPDSPVLYGMTGVVRLPARAEPIGLSVYRRMIRFTNSLLRASQ